MVTSPPGAKYGSAFKDTNLGRKEIMDYCVWNDLILTTLNIWSEIRVMMGRSFIKIKDYS